MTASTPQPSNDELISAVYSFAIDLMKQGLSNAEVIAALVAKGLDDDTSAFIVNNLARVRSQVMRKVALRNMGIGAVVFIIGLAITVVTYTAASSTGGSAIITWGAVIFGAIQFFRGLYYYLRAKPVPH